MINFKHKSDLYTEVEDLRNLLIEVHRNHQEAYGYTNFNRDALIDFISWYRGRESEDNLTQTTTRVVDNYLDVVMSSRKVISPEYRKAIKEDNTPLPEVIADIVKHGTDKVNHELKTELIAEKVAEKLTENMPAVADTQAWEYDNMEQAKQDLIHKLENNLTIVSGQVMRLKSNNCSYIYNAEKGTWEK